ncbi:MAG: hypothetical protein PVI81_02235 [Anaerolineales bacterium]|jgi:hypothetical protein
MTLIEPLKKLIRIVTREKQNESVSPEYSYRIFWTREALSWTIDERALIMREVEQIIRRNDFEANAYIRRYPLDTYGGKNHAGASILVLHEVLLNFDRIESSGGLE